MKKSTLLVTDLAKKSRLPRTIKDVELKTMVTGARMSQGGTCSGSDGGDCDE